VLAEDEISVGYTYRGGRHDLVGERIGHHAVLVDAGLVGEGVGSDYCFVGCCAEADALGEELAGWVELLHLDVVGVRELIAANHQRSGDFLEGGVTGALTDAVDGALDLTGSALDASQ
jgi:hypothetical protein